MRWCLSLALTTTRPRNRAARDATTARAAIRNTTAAARSRCSAARHGTAAVAGVRIAREQHGHREAERPFHSNCVSHKIHYDSCCGDDNALECLASYASNLANNNAAREQVVDGAVAAVGDHGEELEERPQQGVEHRQATVVCDRTIA